MKMNDKSMRLSDAIYYFVFTLIFIFLIWKCRYGYANMDEAFYLTIPYRLCMGDGLFIHEWHLSQMASLLLYPIMKFYLFLFHDTEGILLHFRWLFTVVWSASALFIRYRLGCFSKVGSYVAALTVLIYAPFGIMALSYNSLGIMTLLCACVILITAKTHLRIQYSLSGVLYACSVLCCPYNIVIYIFFTVATFFSAANGKSQLIRCWLFVTIFSVVSFCIFCAFVFSKCQISTLFKIIPWILDDPEHPHVSFFKKSKDFIECSFSRNAFTKTINVFGTIFIIIGRIKKDSRPICFAGISLIIMASLIQTYICDAYLNFIMYPMMLMGIYCAFTCSSRKIRLLFWGLWFQGFLYSFLLNLSSNQKYYAISSGTTLCTVASIVMAMQYVQEMKKEHMPTMFRRIMLFCLSFLFVLQIGIELQVRYTSVFWEEQSMQGQTTLAEDGPEKGILMTPVKIALCNRLSDGIKPIKDDDRIQNVLFVTPNVVSYLYAEKEFATYSAWLSGLTRASVSRMDAYYRFNPEKIPDIVYMEDAENPFFEYFIEKGYIPEEYDSCWYIRKPI